jgi:hypothetical protein
MTQGVAALAQHTPETKPLPGLLDHVGRCRAASSVARAHGGPRPAARASDGSSDMHTHSIRPPVRSTTTTAAAEEAAATDLRRHAREGRPRPRPSWTTILRLLVGTAGACRTGWGRIHPDERNAKALDRRRARPSRSRRPDGGFFARGWIGMDKREREPTTRRAQRPVRNRRAPETGTGRSVEYNSHLGGTLRRFQCSEAARAAFSAPKPALPSDTRTDALKTTGAARCGCGCGCLCLGRVRSHHVRQLHPTMESSGTDLDMIDVGGKHSEGRGGRDDWDRSPGLIVQFKRSAFAPWVPGITCTASQGASITCTASQSSGDEVHFTCAEAGGCQLSIGQLGKGCRARSPNAWARSTATLQRPNPLVGPRVRGL